MNGMDADQEFDELMLRSDIEGYAYAMVAPEHGEELEPDLKSRIKAALSKDPGLQRRIDNAIDRWTVKLYPDVQRTSQFKQNLTPEQLRLVEDYERCAEQFLKDHSFMDEPTRRRMFILVRLKAQYDYIGEPLDLSYEHLESCESCQRLYEIALKAEAVLNVRPKKQ